MKKIGLVLLLVLLVTICGCTPSSTEESTTTKIVWNIGREDYLVNGESVRPVTGDGSYAIQFAVDGKQEVYKVSDKNMLSIIDFNDILVLEVTGSGVIKGVTPISEYANGSFAAQASFVKEEPTGSVVSCNTSIDNVGTDFNLNITESTRIYNVSSAAKVCGEVATLQERDQITAIADKDGNITHIYITSRKAFDPNHTNHCVCCGNAPMAVANHTCDTVTNDWTAWSGVEITSFENLSGKYYLTQDVHINDPIRTAGDLTICLNGYKLTCPYVRVNATSTLTITDCSAEQTGIFRSVSKNYPQYLFANGADAQPITVNIWGGTVSSVAEGNTFGNVFRLGSSFVGTNHVLNIYAGTIQGCTALGKPGKAPNGGGVHLAGNTICNMYGGTIVGGKAQSNDELAGNGGNMYISENAVFNMYGGTITGGSATASGTNIGEGGNIYVTGNGTLNLNGGTVTNGTATNGANIMVNSGTVNVVNVDGSYSFNVNTEKATVNTQGADSSVTVTVSQDGTEYTLTKAAS